MVGAGNDVVFTMRVFLEHGGFWTSRCSGDELSVYVWGVVQYEPGNVEEYEGLSDCVCFVWRCSGGFKEGSTPGV